MPEVLAVVPARGGSRGLPRKNLREVAGTSLVARAVAAAHDASSVDRVVGSTDDPEIAAELARAGAEIPAIRPPELADDDARDVPVFLHMLRVLEATGYAPDIVVSVRPTAPLRTGVDIDEAIEILLANPECRSVKSVSEASQHPYKMWTLGEDGVLRPLLPDWRAHFDNDPDVPRQRLPRVYRSNGAVDAVWVRALKETRMFHPGPVAAFVMDARRAVDVDDADDLALAARLLEEDGR